MIYHILTKADWNKYRQGDVYLPPSLQTEGFIHCSPEGEILETARQYFKGQDNLIVLCIDPEQIQGIVRYEPAAGRVALMPHIYGPLPLNTVSLILHLYRDRQGEFILGIEPENPD